MDPIYVYYVYIQILLLRFCIPLSSKHSLIRNQQDLLGENQTYTSISFRKADCVAMSSKNETIVPRGNSLSLYKFVQAKIGVTSTFLGVILSRFFIEFKSRNSCFRVKSIYNFDCMFCCIATNSWHMEIGQCTNSQIFEIPMFSTCAHLPVLLQQMRLMI